MRLLSELYVFAVEILCEKSEISISLWLLQIDLCLLLKMCVYCRN